MPKVTIDPTQYEKYELKSAPPDGYVMLRPLPYGMKLSRRSKATKMMMRSDPAPNSKLAKDQSGVFELETMDEWSTAFDFQYCIGEHNLEGGDGELLNFNKSIDSTIMVIKLLDPKVGAEIERAIDALNNDEDEESLEDFLARQGTSSEAETNSSNTGGKETPTPMVQP
jgi:hypothetical protein